MAASGLFAAVSVLTLFVNAAAVADEFDAARTELASGIPGLPSVSQCETDAETNTTYCPVEDGYDGLVRDPATECYQGGTGQQMCAGLHSFVILLLAGFADFATIAANGGAIVAFVAMALALYIPTRYVLAWRRIPTAMPTVLPVIRRTAWLQLVFEVARVVAVTWLFDGLQLVDDPITGSFGIAILTAPAVLFFATRAPTQDYFGTFEFQEAVGPDQELGESSGAGDAAP